MFCKTHGTETSLLSVLRLCLSVTKIRRNFPLSINNVVFILARAAFELFGAAQLNELFNNERGTNYTGGGV